jgi:hypothetical protein
MVQHSVTVAANSRSLCTLANVKTQLGISGSGEDARITALIVAASMQIRRWLGREPWLQTYLEKRPGQGGTNLCLKHWPIKGDPASVTYGTGSSPSTVTASTYSVGGQGRRDRLFRTSLWAAEDVLAGAPTYGAQQPAYNITYTAGWVMPDELTEWAVATAFATNAWCKSTDADEPFVFQATVGGTTHAATEPTWPTASEGTVTDNDITWTAYAQRLPEDLEEWAMALAVGYYDRAPEVPSHIAEEGGEGWRVKYRHEGDAFDHLRRAIQGAYA